MVLFLVSSLLVITSSFERFGLGGLDDFNIAVISGTLSFIQKCTGQNTKPTLEGIFPLDMIKKNVLNLLHKLSWVV